MENEKKGQNSPLTPNKKKKNYLYWIYGVMLVAILATFFLDFSKKAETISKSDFETLYLDGNIEKIKFVNQHSAEIYLYESHYSKYDSLNELGKGPHLLYNGGSQESFDNLLTELNLKSELRLSDTTYNSEQLTRFASWTEPDYENVIKKDNKEMLSWIFPVLFFVLIWVVFMRVMRKGGAGGAGSQLFNVGKSKAKLADTTNVKVNFNDVAGLEEAKVEVMEIVDFLKNPKKYTNLGGKIPKGALLVGLPGTGKTLLAKAVAGEAKVPFFSLSGSDFVEMFVGVGASRVRDLFKQAKEKAPCIIFIDEIDAIGRARGKGALSGGNDERENTLNQLLSEMDGFDTNNGVIILAATNRAEVLDSALLRAGRFDRQIHVDLPDLVERRDVFKVHLRGLKLGESIKIATLAKQTPGFSGADIANVCNESALIAARKGKKEIDKQDFMDAIDRIIGGLEKKNTLITAKEKKRIAYHEAGHAGVSWVLEHANPLVKVTIVPRGKALGAAWYLPEERQITTYEQLYDEMTAALGGRASEEIFFGNISTGALNDLEKVSKQAFSMVAYLGLNDVIGNRSYYDSSGNNEYQFTKPFSEKTAQTIDEEVHKLIEKSYIRAKGLIVENKDKIEQLAKLLGEKEVIFSDDVLNIFGARPEGSRVISLEDDEVSASDEMKADAKKRLSEKKEEVKEKKDSKKDSKKDNNNYKK